MKQNNLIGDQNLFPRATEIPETLLKDIPCIQTGYITNYVIPLIDETERRRAAAMSNLFNSHMFDGSAVTLKEILTLPFRFWNVAIRMKSFLRSRWGSSEAKRTM